MHGRAAGAQQLEHVAVEALAVAHVLGRPAAEDGVERPVLAGQSGGVGGVEDVGLLAAVAVVGPLELLGGDVGDDVVQSVAFDLREGQQRPGAAADVAHPHGARLQHRSQLAPHVALGRPRAVVGDRITPAAHAPAGPHSQRNVRGVSRIRITCAGTPATTAFAGTSVVSTELVPTIAFSPTATPRSTHAP